ncbi:carboxypeptidase-like regulatory domain-containing protein [uncultured Alistipes sp.]|jgi:outer membrane cobalamin receptor|uniref:TonB-dependent receptor n=2 Tax=Alistipes TaxID=239759 RepID=UPI000E85F425|nr:carboxypeptidase-like regulatory domain-containing protein [uncultured Alistipes sp.]HBL71192.1 TonB-dependent receptor [Alistipes sp.]HBW01373.1 TonB-dependent receptor [Alistipes sp.]
MKKPLLHFLLMAAFILIGSSSAIAQSTVIGKVVDENDAPLIGATVIVPGTSTGTGTDAAGNFSLKVDAGTQSVEISFIGYVTETREIKGGGRIDLGTIVLKTDAVTLQDVIVSQSVAVQRKTPVAVSTVTADEITYKLGGQEFPEILKSTPGVYVTKDGGGFGDAKINMRGFQSANVAVMVNGVPVNDMEWGGVYWSNWAGLSDVTRSMQTQRGLGASKISAPSVGGSVNIVTNGIDAKKGGTFSFGVGNDGLYNLSLSLSTGLTKNGWAMSILAAKRWGDGYIQGTNFEGYNWFVNISKRINDRHQLSLTAFGAPQKHGQRNALNDGLTIAEWQKAKNFMGEKDMYRYNASYGFDKNGKQRYSSFNEYHKPQISLNHQWQIDYKSSLSTALYMSIGRGSGYSGQGRTSADRNAWKGTNYGILNTTFRNPDGTFAYDKIQELNAASIDGSRMVMSKSNNNHMWYGLLSTYTNQITPSLELSAGVDVRYYIGEHNNEIIDLYDGKYFIDDNSRRNVKASDNIAAADPTWQYEKLQVGDKVYRDYDGHVHQEGVFAQLEWTRNKLNAFVSGSISNTGYWRYDRFYYDAEHAESDHVNFLGYTVKGGANYNITDKHNVFANLGYISRAPFFSGGAFLQSTTSNVTNPDPLNERVFSAELGYGFRSGIFTANLNAYYTLWMDKSFVRSTQMSNGDYARINLGGVDARHMGIELDFSLRPTRWMDITGMLSLGNWIWDSNTKGYIYDSQGQPMTAALDGTVASGIMADDHAWLFLKQKGIKVGGSAQTTGAIGMTVRPMKGLRVSADWNAYGNNYADFWLGSGLNGNQTIEVKDPWRIPWGHQLDLSASYRFKIGNIFATIYGNVNNVYNYNYIMDAQSDALQEGIWQNAYAVMYSFGRTYTVRVKINF